MHSLNWTQTTLTLKDYQGTLYSDTSLPDRLADLSVFEEKFATMFFSGNGLINAEITSIQTVVSNTNTAVLSPNVATEVIPDQAAGGMVVTLPANTSGQFTATYSQQAASELDPSLFNFLINGEMTSTATPTPIATQPILL